MSAQVEKPFFNERTEAHLEDLKRKRVAKEAPIRTRHRREKQLLEDVLRRDCNAILVRRGNRVKFERFDESLPVTFVPVWSVEFGCAMCLTIEEKKENVYLCPECEKYCVSVMNDSGNEPVVSAKKKRTQTH